MKDYSELKRLAEAATPGPWGHRFLEEEGTPGAICHEHGWVADDFSEQSFMDTAYMAAANPAAVLSLIADLADYQQGTKAEADAGDEARAEVRKLKAEVEGLRKQVANLSPFKNAPIEGPDLRCLACGGYHYGLANMPCPVMKITAQGDLP